jgi:hypothetical protein
MMNEIERWQMFGLQAIERVNAKRRVWNEFAETMRVLKLAVDRDVLEHLQQLEKYPDSTFIDSLMELYQNTESHELQCILNYLFHRRSTHFLVPWTGGAFAPLSPFPYPTAEKKIAYCPKARAMGLVLSK